MAISRVKPLPAAPAFRRAMLCATTASTTPTLAKATEHMTRYKALGFDSVVFNHSIRQARVAWDPFQLTAGVPDPTKPYRSGIRNPVSVIDTGGYTWPDARLVEIWQAAGALGLHREHRVWTSTGVWRGSLTPYTPDPAGTILPDTLNTATYGDGAVPVREALDLWFAAYQTIQLHFATLLAPHSTSSDHFGIGSENRTLTRPSRWPDWDVTQFWRDAIAAVRAVWPGKIIYDADWGSGVTGYKTEADWIEFWDDVDLIGIHIYFPTTSSYAEKDARGRLIEGPEIDKRLRESFTDHSSNTYNWYGPTGYLQELSARWSGKKIWIGEYGAASWRQKQYEASPPASTDDGLKSPVLALGAPPAAQPQRLNYTEQPQRAMLAGHNRAAGHLTDVVAGMVYWQGFINSTLGIAPTVGTDHRFADKPSVEKVALWLNKRTVEGQRDAILKWPDVTSVWNLNDASAALLADAKSDRDGTWQTKGHLAYVGWHDHALWSEVPDADWDDRLDAALAADCNIVRLDVAHASLEEDGPVANLDATTGDDGAYHRNRLRAYLAVAEAKGVGVLVMITHTPSWLGADVTAPPTDGGVAFARVCAWIAGLSPAVKAVQVWNEPNLADSWTGTTSEMMVMHGAAFDAIKAANPAMPVVTAGLSTGASYSSYLTAYGTIPTKVDGIGFHPYVDNENGAACVASIATFKTARNLAGLTGRKVWITEFGWTTSAADPGRPWTTGWTVTEAVKAANIAAVMAATATDTDIAAAIVYSGATRTDGDVFNEGFSVLGAAPTYTPKLSEASVDDGLLTGTVTLTQTALLTGEGGNSTAVSGGGHGLIADHADLRAPGSVGLIWRPSSTTGTQRLLEKPGAWRLAQTPGGFQATVYTPGGEYTATATIPPIADTTYEVWFTHHDDAVITRPNPGSGAATDLLVTTKTRRLNLVVNGTVQAVIDAPGDIVATNTPVKVGQGASGRVELAWTANGWPSNTTGGAFRSISPIEMETLHLESGLSLIVAPPASSYEALVQSQGRTSHWRLQETTGTDATDAASNYGGVYVGGATLNQSPSPIVGDSAARFVALDGSNDKLTFTATAGLFAGNEPFYLDCWIRPKEVPVGGRIWSWEDASVTHGFQLTYSTGGINFSRVHQTLDVDGVTVIGGFDTAIADVDLLVPNVWNHLHANYDPARVGEELAVFIQGLLAATRASTAAITIPAGVLTLGAKSSGGGYVHADIAEPSFGAGATLGRVTEFEVMDRYVQGSGNDPPQAAHVANGRRRAQYPWGQSNVRGSALADAGFSGGFRIALPEPMAIDRVLVPFNMAGVDFDVGDPRVGYGKGDGGRPVASLYPCKPDGTPDFLSLVAQDVWAAEGPKPPAQARYDHSKETYAPGSSIPKTQLIEQRFATSSLPDELYWIWWHSTAPDPANNYVSINTPTVISYVAGPHMFNNLNKYEPGALMGLDPREVCGWMVDGIMYWGLEFGRGPVGGGPRWAHQTVGAVGDESNGCRLPQYILFRSPTADPEPYQPYTSYFDSANYPTQGQYTITYRILNQPVTLRYAGGYPPKGSSLGYLTVTNLKSGLSAQTTGPVGQANGPRLPSMPLSQPIVGLPGEAVSVSNVRPDGGRVQLAAGDNYIRTAGKLSPTAPFWPISTTGLSYRADGSTLTVEPTDGAQLFALTDEHIGPYYDQEPTQAAAIEIAGRGRRPFGMQGRHLQVGVG